MKTSLLTATRPILAWSVAQLGTFDAQPLLLYKCTYVETRNAFLHDVAWGGIRDRAGIGVQCQCSSSPTEAPGFPHPQLVNDNYVDFQNVRTCGKWSMWFFNNYLCNFFILVVLNWNYVSWTFAHPFISPSIATSRLPLVAWRCTLRALHIIFHRNKWVGFVSMKSFLWLQKLVLWCFMDTFFNGCL